MSQRARLSLVITCLLFLGPAGCSRLSSLRQRAFHRTTSVPVVELGELPPRPTQTARPARRLSSVQRELSPERAPIVVRPTWETVGHSVEGRPIEAMRFGYGTDRVLIIGGIHGDEPEGLPLIEQFAKELARDPPLECTVLVVRDLNPDGTAAGTRTNSRGVDLNRNFPATNWDAEARAARFNPGPYPASEPETQLLVEVIREFDPHRILVMHSTRGEPMVNYDGPARQLADALSFSNHYQTSDTIGYPTPGSLGSYAGKNLGLPIITLELPRGIQPAEAWRSNRSALYRLIQSPALF